MGKLHAVEKEGYDCGLLQPDQQPASPGPVRGDLNSPKNDGMLSGSRDHAHWDDRGNFDHNLANRVPMNGLDATVWDLFHGKVNKS